MKQQSNNLFNEGLNLDLNPLTTPNNVLTDCINGTFLTFNADELSLQNDAGNTGITLYPEATEWESGATYAIDAIVFDPTDKNSYYKNLTGTNSVLSNATNWESIIGVVRLTEGFFPLGIKEYGGVLYIISGKLPTVPASEVLLYTNATFYTEGMIVYLEVGDKTFYKKRGSIQQALPLESNIYWEVIGSEKDYNNSEGSVEIGSYPSPDLFVFSSGNQFIGEDLVIELEKSATIDYQWVDTGNNECELVELNNTGYLLVEKKKQVNINGVWTDTGDTKIVEELNTVECPLPVTEIRISVSSTTYSIPNEEVITYEFNKDIVVTSPILAGFNYLFFSVPYNKTLKILNIIGQDITSSFTDEGFDSRIGFTKNTIYKKKDMFATDLPATFTIKLS